LRIVRERLRPPVQRAAKSIGTGRCAFDEIINVAEEPLTISVDSIEVTIPHYFHDEDFRLTITKLDNPPPAPNNMIAGTAYDVTVSFADNFAQPLLIKFKNIDKTRVAENDIDKFKAVYFDDKERTWKHFGNSHISLHDST
jgi:hypothetical protein